MLYGDICMISFFEPTIRKYMVSPPPLSPHLRRGAKDFGADFKREGGVDKNSN